MKVWSQMISLGVLLMCYALGGRTTVVGQEDVAKVLKAQTQALLDAVSNGDPRVWDRYLDPRVLYLSEDGTRKSKTDLLKEITPLPKGISGTITVSNFEVRVHGDTAIATHDDLEDEDYFGHKLKAEYRTTDTWLRTAQGWKDVPWKKTR